MTLPIFKHSLMAGGTGQGTVGFSDGSATDKLTISRASAVGKHIYIFGLIWGSQTFTSVAGDPVGALADWDDVLATQAGPTVSSTAGSSHLRLGMWHKIVEVTDPLDLTLVKSSTTGVAAMFVMVHSTELVCGDIAMSTGNTAMSCDPATAETTRSLYIGAKNSQSTTVDLNWNVSGASVIGDWWEVSGTTKLGYEAAWLDTPTLAVAHSCITSPSTTCRIMVFQLQEVIDPEAEPEDVPPAIEVPATTSVYPAQSRSAIVRAVDPEEGAVEFSMTDGESWMSFADIGEDPVTGEYRCQVTATPPPGTTAGTYTAVIEATDFVNTVEVDVDFLVKAATEFIRMPSGQVLPVVSTAMASVGGPPPVATGEWRRMIVRLEAEQQAGLYGGGGKQHMRAMSRCHSDPSRVYGWVDIAHTVRCDNALDPPGELLWHRPKNEGYGCLATTAGAVSRSNPDIAVVLVDDHFEDWNYAREGLYRTTDGAESWTHVLSCHPDIVAAEGGGAGAVAGNVSAPTRLAHETILNSSHNTSHWFAMVDGDGLYRSTDNGVTWTLVWDTSENVLVKDTYKLLEDPTTQGTFYVACWQQVWKLTSAHSGTLVATNIKGTLPTTGMKRYICFENGQDGTSALICSVQKNGAYRSILHDGTDWLLIHGDSKMEYVWVHPDVSTRAFKLKVDGIGLQAWYSTGGPGGPFSLNVATVQSPGWADAGGDWGSRIQGRWVSFMPNRDDPDDIMCYSQSPIWKTVDRGVTWISSNELNCGYNAGWSWRAAWHDPEDALHFWFSSADVGPIETEDGGKTFRLTTFLEASEKNFAGSGAHASATMDDNRNLLVAAIGDTNHSYMMRSTNRGTAGSWTNVLPGIDRRFLGIWTYKLDPSMDATTRNLAKRFALAGYHKTTNAGTSWSETGLPVTAEWNGYMWDQPNTFYGIRHLRDSIAYPSPAVDPDQLRKIYKGVVDLTTGAVAVTTVASLGYPLAGKSAWAYSHQDTNLLYITTSTGDIARWNVATQTATPLNLFSETPLATLKTTYSWLAISMMDVCALNDDWVAVMLNVHGASLVWRSLDGGDTWEDISKNLPRLANGNIEWNHHTGELIFSSSAGFWIHPHPDTHTTTKPLLYSNCAPVDLLF